MNDQLDTKGQRAKLAVEPEGKRGWFAPTAIILLVLSVMGNVVLYTFYLQNGKDAREAAGHAVSEDLQLVAVTSAVVAEKLSQLPAASLDSRIILKVELEQALTQGLTAMERLVPAAEERSPNALDEAVQEAAATFYMRSSDALRGVGAHEGELTAEEQALAAQLQEAYSAIAAEASALPLPSEMTDLAAIQLAAGGIWVDHVYALAERMAELEFPPSV